MERRSPPDSFLSSHTLVNVFRTGSALAGLVALGTLVGCGAPEGDDLAGVEARTDEIVAVTQAEEFKYLSVVNSPSTGLVGDPAFCTPDTGIGHAKIMFTRDGSNYIQGQADVTSQGDWAKYGSASGGRKLGGRPACGFLVGAEGPPPYPFILMAKGANAPDGSIDRHLFWSKGSWNAIGTAPPPTALTPFAAIDGTQYSTNGNPAIGTHNGQLVVVYLKDNGQLAGNYWTGNGFSPTLNHPNLPTGWTGQGTPAIAFAGSWSQKFSIFVRAKDGFGRIRLYETFFDGTHFTSAAGGATGVYQQVTLPAGAPAMDSDPAYEFDNDFDTGFITGTLYYRNGTKLYQVSATNGVDQFNNATLKQVIAGGGTPAVAGNPAVIGGIPYEFGHHWILTRSAANTLLWGESYNNEALVPN